MPRSPALVAKASALNSFYMPTSFQTLALPADLTLTDEQIKTAYDASGRAEQHLTARNTLLHPASRLEAWMKLNQLEVARHASIPDELIPLFSQLSQLINEVSQLALKKQKATTLLSQTLIDKQLFQTKPELDQLAHKLATYRNQALASLSGLQNSPHPTEANTTLQTLKFLRKWEHELDKSYTQLL